ncbi:MAG: hydroxyacylglutathione hydrolase [Candidatus Poriferisodalaceae bacterium]|jgi:hydroxyacylglutathione hydrolase|tara:strand:- start:5434 stop:6150 length:717 start_codon:yes stop_codon:yes gene_type:complete
MSTDRFYFRQLLSGRDFAVGNQLAEQMANFVYLIGDRETGDAVAVDPAYGVADLLDILADDDMRLSGVLATHYHPDHVGGSMMGHSIEGIRELLELQGVKIHVQAAEAQLIKKVTEVSDTDLMIHDPGDRIMVGEIPIDLIHTPGHTPGSQCFLVEGTLVAGDTLFLEGCGRTDLPGSDPSAMFHSLHHTLSKVPDDTVLFPGHRYSFHSSATMGMTRELNYVFKPSSEQQWMTMFGQ